MSNSKIEIENHVRASSKNPPPRLGIASGQSTPPVSLGRQTNLNLDHRGKEKRNPVCGYRLDEVAFATRRTDFRQCRESLTAERGQVCMRGKESHAAPRSAQSTPRRGSSARSLRMRSRCIRLTSFIDLRLHSCCSDVSGSGTQKRRSGGERSCCSRHCALSSCILSWRSCSR